MPQISIPSSRNLIETILILLLLLGLLAALYDVLKIFFGVFTFALIFFVSLKEPFEKLVGLLKQRRKLAAVLYSVILILIVALPFVYVVAAMGKHLKDAINFVEDVRVHGVPNLPENVTNMPVIGNTLASFWKHLQENPRETFVGHQQQLRMVLHHLLTGGVGIIGTGLQVMLGIILSSFLLAGGGKILRPLESTLEHLLGKRDGSSLIEATTLAIKGVSIGVMGTAFIAAVLSWIGFAIAGLHFKILLVALVFFLVLIQIGPIIVWAPLVAWAIYEGHNSMAIFLVIYGVFVLIIDAVLKPILIAKSGGKLPFLVLFIGVVGGLAAWGFTGMFKGAIIMAVANTIFVSWMEKKNNSSPVSNQ